MATIVMCNIVSSSSVFICKSRGHQLRRYTVTIRSCHLYWIHRRPLRIPGYCWQLVAPTAVCTPNPDRTALARIPDITKFNHIGGPHLASPSLSYSTQPTAHLIGWQQRKVIGRIRNHIAFTARIAAGAGVPKSVQTNAQHSVRLERRHK